MAANQAWFYVREPAQVPKADDIFELRTVDMPEVKEGMVLVKTILAAVAPHSRAFLELPGNNTGAEAAGLKRTKLGQMVPTELVAEVVETKSSKFKVGDRVTGFVPLQQYWAFKDDGSDQASRRPPSKMMPNVPPESALSFSSMLTSHIVVNKHACGRVDETCCAGGCFSFLRPKAQKTVLVTSAAGGVGLAAGQLYKNKGCKVIGVTSTKEKAARAREFGFDHVIAYKEEDMDARLGELAPEGLDVFFDNVGARQMDIGSKHMKLRGKIVQVGTCSEIDNFASGNIAGWREYGRLCARELQVGGFLLSNHFKEIPAAIISLIIMMKRGKMRTAETLVPGGLAKFTECVDRVFSGDGFGRIVLQTDETVNEKFQGS